MEHARFSPSGASRWIACPGSIQLSQQVPKEPSSPFAHEGTVCHSMAEKCLLEKTPAETYLNQTVDNVLLTQELCNAIQMHVDTVRSTAKENSCKGFVEKRVHLDGSEERPGDVFGTIDALMYNTDLLIVSDAKYGVHVPVYPEENPQLMIYALAAMRSLSIEYGLKPTEIWLQIIQPRQPDPIRIWRTNRDTLISFYRDKLLPAMKAANQETPIYLPGEEQCRWCDAAGICRAAADRQVAIAQDVFGEFIIPEEDQPPPSPKDKPLDGDEVGALLKHFKEMRAWMLRVEQHATSTLLAGGDIAYHKLVQATTRRKWGQPDEDTGETLRKYIPFEDVYSQKIISPAQAEKLVKKGTPDFKAIQKLIIKPEGGPALATSADKRPDYQAATPEEDFQDYIEEPPPPAAKLEVEIIKEAVGDRKKWENRKRPKDGSKRAYLLSILIENDTTLEDIITRVWGEEGTTVSNVKNNLRLMNVKDGWGYRIYADGRVALT